MQDEVDPLDAFMADLANLEETSEPAKKKHKVDICSGTDDFHLPSHQHTIAATIEEDYDSDREVYAAADAILMNDKSITRRTQHDLTSELPPPKQHSKTAFTRNFYEPHEDIIVLTDEDITAMRRALSITVKQRCGASNVAVPAPVAAFEQCFRKPLLTVIRDKAGYKKPTPIQSQALPIILSGFDVLGRAPTGSGKTLAFVLGLVIHCSGQPVLALGEGPVGLLLAPTRELCEQIHKEVRRFARPYQLRACAAWGGLVKGLQIKELKEGVEIVVATPGRLIDLLKSKACSLEKVTYVVLDEADRLLDMGFESQVNAILSQTRPDRQTLLFSATVQGKVQRLISDAMHDPIEVIVGSGNADITQRVVVLSSDAEKLDYMNRWVPGYIDQGDVLIFCNQKHKVEELSTMLHSQGMKSAALHGDMDQVTRMGVLKAFRSGSDVHVLVATDIAARGLDIEGINTVILYDPSNDPSKHTHRIGRTGRAGNKEGVAVSLLLPFETKGAGIVAQSMLQHGHAVPDELFKCAMKDEWFKNSQRQHGLPRKASHASTHINSQVPGKKGPSIFVKGFVAARSSSPSSPSSVSVSQAGGAHAPIPNEDDRYKPTILPAKRPVAAEQQQYQEAIARAKAIAARLTAHSHPS